MAAKFTITVSITREPDATDIKGGGVPRSYTTAMPALIDDEIQVKVPAGAVDQVAVVPVPAAVQAFLFMRTDAPVTYKRNAETVVNSLGLTGMVLVAGAPNAGPNVTQFLFSNPGPSPATVYIQVGGA